MGSGFRFGVAGVLLAAGFAALSTGAVGQGGVSSEDPPGASDILVIDFQAVLTGSEAFAAVQQRTEEIRNAFRAEFSILERDLRVIEQQLSESRDELPADEFNRMRRDFEGQVVEAQRAAQERRATLDRVVASATDQIRQVLLSIIADVAEEKAASLVLENQTVVLVSTQLDITALVLDRLNSDLPTIDLEFPEVMPLAAPVLNIEG